MKGFWLILVAGSISARPVAGSFFETIWANEQDFFDKINEKIEESNKTEPPTSQPSMKPTLTPTVALSAMPSTHPSLSPTISHRPSSQPSTSPTASSKPSNQPSATPSSEPSSMPSSQPSIIPSGLPSISPTLSASPSSQPSINPTLSASPSSKPSLHPTISTSPSSQPSAQPTLSASPSTEPSLAPSTSAMPTNYPSSEPSSVPSKYPSTSPSDEPTSIPSEVPSETKPITTRIIINSDSSSRNMVAVGAICLFLIASAAAYVSKNAKRLKGGDKNIDEVPSLQYSSSMSESSDESEQHGHDAAKPCVDIVGQIYNPTNRQDDHEDSDMVDIDLEDGRAVTQTEDSVAESSVDLNSLPGGVKEKPVSTISKIFRRRPIGAEMSWMDIRDDGSPACSSGCDPAKGENSITSLSPRFSPFKNISSVRMKMQSLISVSSEETDDLPSVEGSLEGDDNIEECVVSPKNVRGNEGTRVLERFNGSTTSIEHQQCLDSPSIFDGIQERNNDNDCMSSPDSIFSGLGDLPTDEQNMDQLKNILGTIKTLGSCEESFISASSTGTSVTDFKNKAKARLGLNQGQANGHQNDFSQEIVPSRREINMPRVGITFENELLSAAGSNCDGFNFKQIFSDPRNEIYECRVPSGPLGLVVEATKVGLRVQKINAMSPMCNKISVGDIIIAVDEVDVVGVECGFFWQLVSRRANKQQRCFAALRI